MTSTISTSNFRTRSTATHDMASTTFTTTVTTAASNHLHYRIPTSTNPLTPTSLHFFIFNFHHSSTISKLSLTKTHTKLKHISAAKSNSTVVQLQSTSETETPTRVSTKRVTKTKKSPDLRENDDIGKRIMELGNKASDSIRARDRNFRSGSRRYGFDKMGSGDKKMIKKNEVKKLGDGGRKGCEKTEAELREIEFRVALDSCSKHGDVIGGIRLYDEASKEGLKLSQYHYSVLLYLCSSAATGVIRPAKSGSSSRTLGLTGVSLMDSNGSSGDYNVSKVVLEEADNVILVSDEVKKYAVERGYEIYRRMCEENVQMNEASFTAMARIAMSMGNGDLAFDVIKQMKRLGIVPKLRSYGPALSAFCTNGDVKKAFEVESDMLEQGINPEEPELEALLRASVGAGNGDKVYYLLHKLRVNVRRVSSTTAELVWRWFESEEAAMVGKSKWNRMQLKVATENGGGGWHGQGWLGKGPWVVSTTTVGDDGCCKCCGEKLALIDLDPLETEKFAESVASIAMKREKHSNFQKFQQWLDYYGPFEAVVDAANVGLYSQHRFMPTKINAVVNGIRQMLPSKKWPLIVLHNRRVTGNKMDEEVNKALVEKWKNADALYPTPTGSNDDWYWLYAAIKFKCLLVTNDEMRDHTFQLLGNDFFPKWKERHQVRFSFNETGPVFHMPPPCSVVIQESEHGCWHIPIESEINTEEERTWLCITRSTPSTVNNSQRSASDSKGNVKVSPKRRRAKTVLKNEPEEMFTKLKNIIASGMKTSKHRSRSILSEIQNAEKIGNCTIDFQI